MSLRQRATLLVPTAQGLLLTETRKGLWLFPGGGIERDELPLIAAARELKEETDLTALSIRFLERLESPKHMHHLFEVVEFEGYAQPLTDARGLHLLSAEAVLSGQFPMQASPTTRHILQRHAPRMLQSPRQPLKLACSA